MISRISHFDERLQNLLEFTNSSHESDESTLLGSGKYGKVYIVSGTAVKKECKIHNRENSLKQAFREHVIGVIQTLLVAAAYSPHLPIHFDASMYIDRHKSLMGHMYMEKFGGCLQDTASTFLVGPSSWISLSFQVLSTLAILADMLQLTHNDLYPRNILIKECPQNKVVRYNITGLTYVVRWEFLAVITDFGIASSSEIMGKRSAPEVAQSLEEQQVPKKFGDIRSRKHILQYKELPVFSRDIYTYLKWVKYGSKNLPHAPKDVASWTSKALVQIDSERDTFNKPETLISFVHNIFSKVFFDSCTLEALYNCCFLDANQDQNLETFSYKGSEADRKFILEEAEKLIKQIPVKERGRVHT